MKSVLRSSQLLLLLPSICNSMQPTIHSSAPNPQHMVDYNAVQYRVSLHKHITQQKQCAEQLHNKLVTVSYSLSEQDLEALHLQPELLQQINQKIKFDYICGLGKKTDLPTAWQLLDLVYNLRGVLKNNLFSEPMYFPDAPSYERVALLEFSRCSSSSDLEKAFKKYPELSIGDSQLMEWILEKYNCHALQSTCCASFNVDNINVVMRDLNTYLKYVTELNEERKNYSYVLCDQRMFLHLWWRLYQTRQRASFRKPYVSISADRFTSALKPQVCELETDKLSKKTDCVDLTDENIQEFQLYNNDEFVVLANHLVQQYTHEQMN